MPENRIDDARASRNRHFYNVATFFNEPSLFSLVYVRFTISRRNRIERRNRKGRALARVNRAPTIHRKRSNDAIQPSRFTTATAAIADLKFVATPRGMAGLERFRIRLQHEPIVLVR